MEKRTTGHKAITPQTICYVAGKSGGHILPCLQLIRENRTINPQVQILFFTATKPLDYALIQNNPLVTKHVPLKLIAIPGKKIWLYPPFFLYMLIALLKSLWHLYQTKPTQVITTGGLEALPICTAANMLGIPIELYELNATPGKAILWLAPWADKLFVCFEQTKKYFPKQQPIFTPYPLNKELQKMSSKASSIVHQLDLHTDKKTVLVLGGSQGSYFLNRLIQNLVEQQPTTAQKFNIIHQTGNDTLVDWQKFYADHTIPAHVFTFEQPLHTYYAAADIVICRSGAGTLFELASLHKKCITIPLETASTDHQIFNAQAFVAMYPDSFFIIEQKGLDETVQLLSAKLKPLLF